MRLRWLRSGFQVRAATGHAGVTGAGEEAIVTEADAGQFLAERNPIAERA